jgi:phosphoesterase RecJ-like protein
MHGTGGPLGRYTQDVPEDALRAAEAAASALEGAERVLVLGHVGADGDVVGASLGLAAALREMGKDVTVYNERPYPEAYAFLAGAKEVVTSLPADARFDATVVVDAADPDRCGRDFPDAERRGVFVWMDHHRLDEPPGDVNYIDLTAAAVGEQVVQVLDAMGHGISGPVAHCVYVSLVSDTGGFRYGNTSARAHALAGRLVAAGVDTWDMTERLYESQAEERVRLLGFALSTLWRSPDGRVGVVSLSQRDMEQAGALEEHVHGIVNHVRGIRGVEVAVLLRELDKGTKVIFRSKGKVPISRIAELLGGRGNPRSATVMLDESVPSAREQVVRVASEIVNDSVGPMPADELRETPIPEPISRRRPAREGKRPRRRAPASR